MSWEYERGTDGQVDRIKIHTDGWTCPSCGIWVPERQDHNHDRIICVRGSTQPLVPPGRKPDPALDQWVKDHDQR
ncbi:MAG TPA: hypothetical protein VMV23_09290 [Candidatus Nanopelagicaceae bacterium]|nr:hypothetical protein [Candidatus Nanopelagicaceae bacterium]